MKKFGEIIFKILRTIIAVPLGIVASVLLTPAYLVVFLISLTSAIIEDIWVIR